MSNTSLQLTNGEIFSTMMEMQHEQMVFCTDKTTGLKAIIAIHNTTLGPALGGTRFWNYTNEDDAIIDVLRLSRGMTYKAAISGLNLGGGKAVIIGDSKALTNREPLFRRYGKFVNSLNGKYITAEDVGTSTGDMEFINMETESVAGKPEQLGGGGDPSPVTAYGVYLGMKAAAKYANGTDNLSGKRVLVQGVGNVGYHLVERLVKEGAVVMISDISEDRIKKVTNEFSVEVVDKDAVFDTKMDIYAPCALGATINDDTVGKLTCNIVAGAANNQLKDEQKHGMALIDRGILYAPDYLINAGGLINCYSELEGYNRERAMQKTEIIYPRAIEIFEIAAKEKITTQAAANRIAEERIRLVAHINSRL
ncbi:MAG: Glu/Leu/Phe/Val dehydrogenase [Chitinophagales bacterium]|nr:Glu/Leu/Phe/Val dehydrogenase [Bacteroidota bacterium]